MKSIGLSTWAGSWKEGQGTISTTSATFKESPFSYSSRFEGTRGSSPEELLAAALAGCFNQALANNLGMVFFEADDIKTSVEVELGYGPDGFPAITQVSITCNAKVAKITSEKFQDCAERSRTHCTIARLIRIDPSMNATLNE